MGTSSSNKNNFRRKSYLTKKSYIIWIDKNINNIENHCYLKGFKKGNFEVNTYENIEYGLNEILYNKSIYFKNIYIILSGSFYQDFILKFKEHLKDIYVVPKIVIFTSKKGLFLEKNSKIKDIIENKFYNLGGIQTNFNILNENFLIEKTWKKEIEIENISLNNNIEGEQYTFEYINNILELYLPVFYKSFFKLNEKDNFDELTHYLYDKYKENKYAKELLEPIDGIPEIPIEILCKYYARLYTIESKFYIDLNEGLRKGNLFLKEKELLFSLNKNNHYSITFIKSFYEGIKLGVFDLDFKGKLYGFSCLEKKEFDKINEYLKNKKSELLVANLFSKCFLSFYENEEISYNFYKSYKYNISKIKNNNSVPVFFHLIKKENIKESLYSHIKIGDISIYPEEKEILFLPFTCFEILKVIPNEENENLSCISKKKSVAYYIIELIYKGKYEKELKKEEIIPNSKFEESNLI